MIFVHKFGTSDGGGKESEMKTAPVKWAQRKDSLYITIGLPDVKDHKIDVTEKSLSFRYGT